MPTSTSAASPAVPPLLAVAGGGLAALSLPPWGWWPLAIAGLALVAQVLADRPWRRRLLLGWLAGLAYFGVSLYWMSEFTLPGYLIATLLHAAFLGGALALVPPGRGRLAAFPAAVLLAEALRSEWPFGGVPISGLDLGQAESPLAPAARLGGRLFVLGLVAAAACALLLAASTRRRPLVALAVVAGVAAAPVLGLLLPAATANGEIDVVVVQGGGPRGFRAVDTDPSDTFAAHVRASRRVPPGADLVLWPEDVVDVTDFEGSDEQATLAALARRMDATLVAGITDEVGDEGFRNYAVALDAGGREVDRYEKVHRVPFGEYIPLRGLISRVADVSAVPRDAVPGKGPGLLSTPAGPLGVVISYEVFFPDRARAAVQAGGQVLLVPTNAASFSTSQVPAQELAAAQLRAWETDRHVVQAAPTGFSAVVDHRGRVEARSALGEEARLRGEVQMRTGRTLYVRLGDAPVVAAAALLLAAAWWLARRPRSPQADRLASSHASAQDSEQNQTVPSGP